MIGQRAFIVGHYSEGLQPMVVNGSADAQILILTRFAVETYIRTPWTPARHRRESEWRRPRSVHREMP